MSLERSLEFISGALSSYVSSIDSSPIVFGVSGPQGSGKTYLAEHLCLEINERYPNLECIKFSMDDLYLTNSEQKQLTRRAIADGNKLLQGRGLPGTHDVRLGLDILGKLSRGEVTEIPVYDKGFAAGEGDRVSCVPVTKKADVIIFEGWFNGYAPLDEDQVRIKYLTSDLDTSTLPKHKLYQVQSVNEALLMYTAIWSYFDYFIFIDTDIANVHRWRLEQEHAMVSKTGSGMTDLQVRDFVDRYLPVYELYYRQLCDKGSCIDREGASLRLKLSESRELTGSEVI